MLVYFSLSVSELLYRWRHSSTTFPLQ